MLLLDTKDNFDRNNCDEHNCHEYHNYDDEKEHKGHDLYMHASKHHYLAKNKRYLLIFMIILGIALLYYLLA